jgi:hypothetical protein
MGNGSGFDAAIYSLDLINNRGAAFAGETGDLIAATYVVFPRDPRMGRTVNVK